MSRLGKGRAGVTRAPPGHLCSWKQPPACWQTGHMPTGASPGKLRPGGPSGGPQPVFVEITGSAKTFARTHRSQMKAHPLANIPEGSFVAGFACTYGAGGYCGAPCRLWDAGLLHWPPLQILCLLPPRACRGAVCCPSWSQDCSWNPPVTSRTAEARRWSTWLQEKATPKAQEPRDPANGHQPSRPGARASPSPS